MDNTKDLDIFEAEDMFEDEPSGGYSFQRFKEAYPKYLDCLNNYIKLIYTTYAIVHNMRFIKIKKMPECIEIAGKCGFGMLMRHALETISTSLATENGVDVGGRSVYERLTALKGQNIPEYDSEKKAVLFKLLDHTNEIAHPHILHKDLATFSDLESFYKNSFKPVLDSHISYIQNIIKKSKTEEFGVPKEVKNSRKQSLKYLLLIRKRLENFNIFDKSTNILIQGCLVRQLTECTANLWGYNYEIVPTDVSTFENQINLGNVLDGLNRASRAGKRTAFGSSALTPQVVSNLYDLKAASNSLMHVDKFATENIVKQGEALTELYKTVKSECSPHVMKKKLSEAASLSRVPKKKPREKSPALLSTLCGITGWFGFHHFYAGNYFKGVMYLLFMGFVVGPALDLIKIINGNFRNGKGLRMKKTPLSKLLAVIFLVLHILLIYNLATKFTSSDIVNKIKNFNFGVTSLEICESSDIETLSKISVLESSSSSHLETSKKSFDASLCVDSKASTCWQDGVEGAGEGETLTFKFNEKQTLSAISILNGKHTGKKAYSDNARAEKLIIKAGNKKFSVSLNDVMERQSFSLSNPVETDEISIVIESCYEGNKWQDLCISEIEFYKE